MRTRASAHPLRMVVLGLATAVSAAALLATPAALASPATPAAPASPASAAAPHRLSPAECAALRTRLHRPALDCAGIVVTAVAPGHTVTLHAATPTAGTASARAAVGASSTSESGLLVACAYPDSTCTGRAWGVTDYFTVTYIHNVGVWNNSHSCGGYGTNVTWCGTWHNGYSNYMEEGVNFGKTGYARLEIDTYGNTTVGAHNNWTFAYGCLGITCAL